MLKIPDATLQILVEGHSNSAQNVPICQGTAMETKRLNESLSAALLLLSMQSFAELTRSMDPTVTRLAIGQLDRSQSLLERRFSLPFLRLLQTPRQQLVIS
jgi:hypothetical protein